MRGHVPALCPSVPAHRAEKRCENEHKLKRDRECTKKRGEIGDPIAEDTNEEGSIVTLCRWLYDHGEAVDQVWLLSTDSQGQSNANTTRDWLTTEHLFQADQIQMLHREVSPVDFVAVTQFVFDTVQGSSSSADSGHDHIFHFNGTSGTPAMKTSGFLLSVAGLLKGGQIWTVLNPQHAQTTDRVGTQDVRFLKEHMLRERIATAVKGDQFQTAIALAREWGEITVRDTVRETHAALIGVLQAYRAWDLTDFGAARRYLTQVDQMASLPWSHEGRDAFDRQRRWLNNKTLESANENPLNLVELYYSIERYQEHERYTDALARGRRLLEGLLYYYYGTHYQADVRMVAKFWMKQLPRDLTQPFVDYAERYVPLWVLARAIMDYGHDTTLRPLALDIPALNHVMDLRNQSLAAHGMQPVTGKDVATVRPLLRKWLVALVPQTGEYLKQYPLKPVMRRRVLFDLGLLPSKV